MYGVSNTAYCFQYSKSRIQIKSTQRDKPMHAVAGKLQATGEWRHVVHKIISLGPIHVGGLNIIESSFELLNDLFACTLELWAEYSMQMSERCARKFKQIDD